MLFRAANTANVLAYGIFPVVAKPAAVLIIFCSAIPISKNLFGNSFATSGGATATGFGTGIAVGENSKAYAILSSQKSSLMMELLVSYSEWNGHGFGEAKTNDGKIYKVQF